MSEVVSQGNVVEEKVAQKRVRKTTSAPRSRKSKEKVEETIPVAESMVVETKSSTTTEPKSMSYELSSTKMDELLFRLDRANAPYKTYKHKSIQMDKYSNVSEETESRMVIITDFNAVRVLNLLDNDIAMIVLNQEIIEICIYENIIKVEPRAWYDYSVFDLKEWIRPVFTKLLMVSQKTKSVKIKAQHVISLGA